MEKTDGLELHGCVLHCFLEASEYVLNGEIAQVLLYLLIVKAEREISFCSKLSLLI